MRKLTQIIRLHFDAKLSTRPIAKSLGLSVGVVNKYINRALANNADSQVKCNTERIGF